MYLGLDDKYALVLGGSQGLGLAIAKALLAEGARVTIAGRSLERLKAARADLANDERARCFISVADLADPDAASILSASAREQGGAVDILVNNTGGPPASAPSTVSPQDMATYFSSMVQPILALTLDLVGPMRARSWGRVLTIASSGVVQPIPHLPISNALRSSLVGFMKSLASDIAADGVTVNMILPGRVSTERTESLDLAQAQKAGKSVDDIVRASASTIPAGRYGTPEEFAAVAAFLVSAPASYVTGSMVRVDGGLIRSV